MAGPRGGSRTNSFRATSAEGGPGRSVDAMPFHCSTMRPVARSAGFSHQSFLGGELAIEAAMREPDTLHQIGDADAVKAALAE